MDRLKLLWRWSWVVTLPLTLLGAVWLPAAWRDARQFLVWHPAGMHRSSDVDLDLGRIMRARLRALRTDVASAWRARWTDGTENLGRVDLSIGPTALAQLNENLPRSGKESWVRAKLRYPSEQYETVSVRYRGDSIHHWGFAAKSWLVRTSRERLIEGRRRWHLVLPRWRSVGNYQVNLRMAAHMGLLAAESRPVDLKINGRQHGGIHLLQPQQDEAFLRNHARLPSDLYVGDMTPLDDNFVREAPLGGLWQLPWLWQKAAVNNKFAAESRLPLEILFFRLHHAPDADLLEILDLPAWTRFSAYMQLFYAAHMDMGHNWKLLFDTGKLKFEPVVGDGNGLPDDILAQTAGLPARDASITTPLLARLHRNHTFLRLKQREVARFFEQGLDGTFFRELDGMVDAIGPSLRVYPQIDWIGTVSGGEIRYFGEDDLRRRLARVTPDLKRWFAEQRRTASADANALASSRVDGRTVRVEVTGHAPADLALRLPPGTGPVRASLRVVRDTGATEEADISGRLRADGDLVVLDWPLLAQRDIDTPEPVRPRAEHRTRPTTYDLVLDGIRSDAVKVLFRDRDGRYVEVPEVGALPLRPIAADNSGVLPEEVVRESWSGEVVIRELLEVRHDLLIAPGTRVRLAPGASLVLRGRLLADGTPDRPIRFERLESDRPWGLFALVGSGADGSVLRHCRFAGGSGLASPLTLFSGMVSIREVRSVRIEHCEFAENSIFDDLFHAVYSELELRDSTFLRAYRDAIDLDICRARIDGLRVSGAGNDGLDLMTSEVALTRSRLEGCGDKGLSAGEAGRVVVIDTVFHGNNIGMQVKDGTQGLLYNATLSSNRTALSAYHKNTLYPGTARLQVAKSAIGDGQTPADLRDGSLLEVWDSRIAPVRAPGATLAGGSDLRAATAGTDPMPAFGALIPGGHWELARPDRRGSTLPENPSSLP